MAEDTSERELKLSPGQIVSNRYEITRFLGRGGMASVYLASDTLLQGTQVALKVLHVHLQHQSAQYQRFLREVQLTRLVTHPNVVRTYDVGRDGEMIYYTMEIISGVSLDRILVEHGRLPVNQALRYILQVCAGLRAIHRCEVIHRDLKPANILVVEKDQIKITDFGVARPRVSFLTEEDNVCGTLLYIAPEIFRAEPITAASDCYSLGITLYELLTGSVPFRDEVIGKLVGMHLSQTPRPPSQIRSDIPGWLDDLVSAMLEKQPQNRPALEEIMQAIGGRIEEAASDTRHYDSPGVGTSDFELLTRPRSLLERSTAHALRNVRTASYRRHESPVRRASRLLVITALALAVGLTHLAVFNSPGGEWLEQLMLDAWFSIRGQISPPKDVVLISMDEQSYSNLRVPLTEAWPRRLHAQLLQRLAEYGVKRVVFDILFVDAGADKQADDDLAAAMARVPTVLGSSFMTAQRLTANGGFLLEEYIEPYDELLKSAAAVGVVGLTNDFGRIRRFNTEQSDRYQRLVSLAAAGAGAYESPIELPAPYDFINYYGPPRTIQTLSYEMVLEAEHRLPRELLEDKVVVVGLALSSSAGPTQREAFASPFRGYYIFGSEIHATAIGNILHKQWIRRMPPAEASLILSAAAFLLSLLILALSPVWGGLLCLSAGLIWGIGAWLAFTQGYFIPGLLLVGIVLPLTFTLNVLHRQILPAPAPAKTS